MGSKPVTALIAALIALIGCVVAAQRGFDAYARYDTMRQSNDTAEARITRMDIEGSRGSYAYWLSYEFTDAGGTQRAGRQRVEGNRFRALRRGAVLPVRYRGDDPRLSAVDLDYQWWVAMESALVSAILGAAAIFLAWLSSRLR